jgi:hypothetical protein
MQFTRNTESVGLERSLLSLALLPGILFGGATIRRTMGKKRVADRSISVVGQHEERDHGNVKKQKQPHSADLKRQRKQVHHLIEQFKLREEQELRLGDLCSTTQWLIRIAQGKGEKVCLAVREIITSTISNDEWSLVVQSADRQMLPLTITGVWVQEAAQSFCQAGERINDHPFIISGSGANLMNNTGRITYSDGIFLAHILDLSRLDIEVDRWLRPGWIAVNNGKIASKPERTTIGGRSRQNDVCRPEMSVRASSSSQQSMPDSPIQNDGGDRMVGPHVVQHVGEGRAVSGAHLEQTPTLERSASLSRTPDWLKTPASIRRVTSAPVIQTPTPRRCTLPRASRTPDNHGEERAQRRRFVEDRRAASRVRELGQREIVPVQELHEDASRKFSTIGIIVSREEPRRCNGGDFDLTVKVSLQDLYPPPNDPGRPLTFMLFGPDEAWIPVKSKPGDLVCFTNFAMKAYCGARQAVGASRKFDWVLCDRQSGEMSKSIGMDDSSVFYEAVKEDMLKHCRYLRKDSGANSVDDVTIRRLTDIRHVEAGRFFDCDVEVVSKWDSFNPTIYVTDYTGHPKLHCTRDTDLGLLSREELERQRDETGEDGFGHVLPITLWDEQRTIGSQIEVGMRLRLINVRPKISPGGFLEGNMGSGGLSTALEGERLRIFLLDDVDAAHIDKKRAEYEKKVELMRRHARNAQDQTDHDKENHNSGPHSAGRGCDTIAISSFSLLRNTITAQEKDVSSHGKEELPVKLGQMPIAVRAETRLWSTVVEILGAGTEMPLTDLNDVVRLQTDPYNSGSEYRCRVKVADDVVPSTIRAFVVTECAGCKRR